MDQFTQGFGGKAWRK